MKIEEIGSIARQRLGQSHAAVVVGSSQHGIFMSLDIGWIVFLSLEAQHGPLTLNLSDSKDLTLSLPNGRLAQVTSQGIFFHDPELLIIADQAQTWCAPPRSRPALPVDQRREILNEVIERAQSARQVDSLAALQGVRAEPVQLNQAVMRFYPHLIRLAAHSVGQLDLHSVEALLGMGSGLTPSGDDIILGLLLVLNRWGDVLTPELDCAIINPEVLALAYAHTTTLSANLIACASLGQADERLVTALDGLVTGVPGVSETTVNLMGWGHSSGLDALCGMACIL